MNFYSSTASAITIFDIHLILDSIASYLTPQEIENCLLVSISWKATFFPFRRIKFPRWRSYPTFSDQVLGLLNQRRLLSNIWKLTIPLDDPSFLPLLHSNRLSGVRVLSCLDRGTYKHVGHGPGGTSDFDFNDDHDYTNPSHRSLALQNENVPDKIDRLLKTMIQLQSLKIRYENNTESSLPLSNIQPQQFSNAMVRTLADHKTLSKIHFDFLGSIDWTGFCAVLNALPDTIEILKVTGRNLHQDIISTPIEKPVPRIELYPRLRRLQFSKDITQRQLLIGLIPFLRLCPELQDFELDLQRVPEWCERVIADTLLEYCPKIDTLNLQQWSTEEQMRLVRGYALKSLQVSDFILREPRISNATVSPIGSQQHLSSLSSSSSWIPSLILSNNTLERLNLASTHCWTPYHNLDAILSQFPNLKDLTVDWFEFQEQAKSSRIGNISGSTTASASALTMTKTTTMTTNVSKIEKLSLWIHTKPTSEANRVAAMDSAIEPTRTRPPNEVNDEDATQEHFDRYADWSFTDRFGIFQPKTSLTTRQSSVCLAAGIVQLYDLLSSDQFPALKKCDLQWFIYHSWEAIWDDEGRLDVRGPLEIELARQGLDRAALLRMDLHWTEYPIPYDDTEDEEDEDEETEGRKRGRRGREATRVDQKFRSRGVVVTDRKGSPRRSRLCGEPARVQYEKIRAEAGVAAVARSSPVQAHDGGSSGRGSGSSQERECEEDEYHLYKSRNQHRIRVHRDKKAKETRKLSM